ncbi:MAG: efflux RND transporter periplasmic adaptor subunit, partial [Gammaproteobacteria bacterium]|nr:efflux RND transporter periplasmic adaptor subunit [Gammaproteobacteria bacterium]
MSHSNMHWTRQLASLLVVLIAGLALGVGWSKWRAGHHAAGGGASPASAVPAANPERRVLYWHDPMRPELRFDRPGKSPFMDMPLQPVYADDNANAASGEPGVHVSTAAQQQLGIRLGRVERAAISPVVNAVGIVAYDDAAQAIVQPRVDGYVTRLIIRTALEHVRRGQVLAEVDAPAWREALGEYLALSAGSFAGNSALRAALRQRLVVLGVPNAAILQVEQSRTPPARFELTAPVAGVVTELGLREGAAFTAGTVLA